MGCNSSQVHVTSPSEHGPLKPEELCSQIIIQQNKIEPQKLDTARNNLIKLTSRQKIQKKHFRERCFLFGETQTQRKIVCFDLKQYQFSTISSRAKIPQPVLKCLPIEVIYYSALFSNNSQPPYNFMLALWIDSNKIFLCGGITIDFKHVSNEAFIFDTSFDSSGGHRLGNNLMGAKLQKLSFMASKKYSHMGVVYTSGLLKYVYVFGGRGENNQLLADCEKYSIVEKKWIKIAPMKVARSTGYAFVYRQRIYVCGGYSGTPKRTKKIQVYHPNKDYWEVLSVKMHRGLQTGLLFSITPNQLIFIGGNLEYGSVNSMVKVNLDQQTYIAAQEMKHPRVLEKGCITDKEIIVFGGSPHDGLEIYNYKNQIWNQHPSSFTSHIGIQQINSFSYSMQTVQVQYQQSTLKEQNSQRFEIGDSRAILFSHDSLPFILDINFTHSVITKRAVPMTLRLRSHMNCILIKPGKYFLCGGVSQFFQKSTRSSYVYYSGSNRCIQQSKMKTSRYKFSICFYKDQVYVFGGCNTEQQQALWKCQKFSLQQNNWTQIANLNIGRFSAMAVPFNDRIYIVGGNNGVRQLQEIEVYNPSNNTMTLLQKYSKLLFKITEGRIGQEIYLFGKKENAETQDGYRFNVIESIEQQKISSLEGQIIEDTHSQQLTANKLSETNHEKNTDINQNAGGTQEDNKDNNKATVTKQQAKKVKEENTNQQTPEKQKIQSQQKQLQQTSKLTTQQVKVEEQSVSNHNVVQDLGLKSNDDAGNQNTDQKERWQQLLLQRVCEVAATITLSVSAEKSIYLFSSTNKVYEFNGKQVIQKNFANQELMQGIDWERVSIS